ncbi:MAG: hypothetical protein ACREV7_15495 [Steroidobacteraceae bacterium]
MVQPFHAVQHPRYLANAGDDLRLRKQRVEQLHPAAPQPAGVEYEAGVHLRRVEVLDQAAQHCNALVVGNIERKIVLGARLRDHDPHDVG